MTGRTSVAPAVAGRTIRMRVCPVGPTGQTTSSMCESRSRIGCDCKSVRTLCAAPGLSWLSGGPLKPLMNACVVGPSLMEPLLCVGHLWNKCLHAVDRRCRMGRAIGANDGEDEVAGRERWFRSEQVQFVA